MDRSLVWLRLAAALAVAASSCPMAQAQYTAPGQNKAATAPPTAAAPTPLDPLAWLRGCWGGKVTSRDFVEQWLPPRGGMMVGVSHTMISSPKTPDQWQTEDYTYLRLEARPDGVYYVAIPSGKSELAFKLTSVEDDQGVTVFTFTAPSEGFPQRIIYRRMDPEFFFAQVEGTVQGRDRRVTYPMHQFDCMGRTKE